MAKPNLYHIEQLRAINGFLSGNSDYVYRKVCRWFSREFSTPLMEVMKMPMPLILQHYYESQMDNADYNSIYELAKSDYLPEFIKERENEDEMFARDLIKEQQETLKKKEERDKAKSGKKKLHSAARSEKVLEKTQSLTSKPTEGEVPNVEEISLQFDDEGDPDV